MAAPRRLLLAWALAVLLGAGAGAGAGAAGGKRQLVVALLDGVRWDYLERLPPAALSGLQRMREEGARAQFVQTVFPSLTLPAWTTLQTGLHPESHNVLGNRMFDRRSGLEFNGSTAQLPLWWAAAEPFWVTATRQGLRAATLEWNRADVPFEGVLPEVAKGYTNSRRPFAARVDEVLLRLRQGFDLVMVYHERVDTLGHRFGPASPEALREVRRVGRGVERLLEFARARPGVHLLLVSDHGMAPACALPPLDLRAHLDARALAEHVVADAGVAGVWARPGRAAAALRQLRAVPGYTAQLREDLPEELHYKRGGRAPDILLRASPGAAACGGGAGGGGGGGAHGLDPRDPSMRALLLAWGAALAAGGRVAPPLRLVDVYQLFAHVLRVRPRPHNGSWAAVRPLLRADAPPPAH